MRMWLVDPRIMCRKHLLGEHVEIHMLVGAINKGKSLKGFIDNGLIELSSIVTRHAKLAMEMKARGYKHRSPLPDFVCNIQGVGYWSKVNQAKSLRELLQRCPECAERYSTLKESDGV